jgi:hypothetical protein
MMESENIAFSTATRDLLPSRRILQGIEQHSFITLNSYTPSDTIQAPTLPPSKIFEGDNNACIVLATTDMQFKPPTKHISIKFHHFHDNVWNGTLEIIKIGTHENVADIFT